MTPDPVYDRRHPGLYAIEVRNDWHDQVQRAEKMGRHDLFVKYIPQSQALAHLKWCTEHLAAELDKLETPDKTD